jgi:hypothetical protein
MNNNKILSILNKYITLVDFHTITRKEDTKYFVEADELFCDLMNDKNEIINDENVIDFAHKINNIIVKYE